MEKTTETHAPTPLRLLVVEDSQCDAEIIVRELRRGGFDVTWKRVETEVAMREALAAEPWDAVISDFRMPQFDGLGSLQVLHEKRLDIPFIVVSGTIGEETAVMVLKAGAHDYLMKDNLARLAPAVKRELRDAALRRDRCRLEEELREREAKYRSLFENSIMGISQALPDGRLLRANQAYAEMYGYSNPAKMMAEVTSVGQLYADPDERTEVLRILSENGVMKPREVSVVRRDGSRIVVLVAAREFRDAAGNLLYYQAENLDITGRKNAELAKANLEAQLHQAQKMESVGRLAGGVAHDFNNMLGVILGHVELATDQVDPANPIHADLTEIRKAAERSADLTRQLLAFARKQPVSPIVLDPNETVAGMLKMLQRLIGEEIGLAWLPKAGVWSIHVDPSQIDQILANLCINARDAIQGRGKVTVETGNVTFDEPSCTGLEGCVPGEFVLLAVNDDGCGMDEETLGKIFEPFFTTKENGKGTGLGLAMVYGIVKQNNGFIKVHSEPGRGTTFKVYLPRHTAKADQMPKGGSPAKLLTRGNETILLVEDEPAILSLTKKMLERQGYTILAAPTPGEALRLAKEHPGEIHLLMTDVVMPGMNGQDLASKLLSQYPSLKCLFMSGHTADVIAHNGILDEGVQFIQKPFSMKALTDKVRAAISQK